LGTEPSTVRDVHEPRGGDLADLARYLTEDAREGQRAFVENRPPRFRGR
jgi:1,4-dihydroxy-2-naphthoyl-CoA synthase